MHDTIQQQLGQSHVKQFTDLSESEKQLFMERAAKALENGEYIIYCPFQEYFWLECNWVSDASYSHYQYVTTSLAKFYLSSKDIIQGSVMSGLNFPSSHISFYHTI